MTSKGIWIAFGIGVSAGAAVALLYAPQTGVKTRRQLKKNIDDGVDYLEEAASFLKQQADYLTKEAQKIIERSKGQLNEAIDTATSVTTGAVKSVQSLM